MYTVFYTTTAVAVLMVLLVSVGVSVAISPYSRKTKVFLGGAIIGFFVFYVVNLFMVFNDEKLSYLIKNEPSCVLEELANTAELSKGVTKYFLNEARYKCLKKREREDVRLLKKQLLEASGLKSSARIIEPSAKIVVPSDSFEASQDFKDALGSSALNEGIDLGFPQGDENVPMGGMPVIDLGTMQNSK